MILGSYGGVRHAVEGRGKVGLGLMWLDTAW
jgi:hypothetical protein